MFFSSGPTPGRARLRRRFLGGSSTGASSASTVLEALDLGLDLPPVFFHVLAAARSASLYDMPFDLPLAYTDFTCAIQLEAGIFRFNGVF